MNKIIELKPRKVNSNTTEISATVRTGDGKRLSKDKITVKWK